MSEWSAVWRGGRRAQGVAADDRGLAYGDGLFETLRASGGALPWWLRHRTRLLVGAERLGLPLPADAVFDEALAEAVARFPDGVVKLLVTRGGGDRGYAPGAQAEPMLLVTAGPAPPRLPPLVVGRLELRLAVQPALAGLKHLNRLEQVLGAAEAQRRGLDDGLMADADGEVLGSTRANLFAFLDGHWITPPVERAGVAGVTRGVLLEGWPALSIAALPEHRLPHVEALFLANAVRGILPVHGCDGRLLAPRDTDLDTARAVLAASHPAFREA